MLNVHLVPHTHDDVGWFKTVDKYYVGSDNSIQGACVQNVLDSLVPSLLGDRNRKFIYAEMLPANFAGICFINAGCFPAMWREQSEAVKHIVKQLVSSDQLEFINGVMCMHEGQQHVTWT